MANEIFKEIKTRIALKQNTYSYWFDTTGGEPAEKKAGAGEKAYYVPLYGEVCFCEITTTNGNNQTTTTPPTVLFKVGNGTEYFKDLNWASALAADVYSWAKKEHLDASDLPTLPIEVVDNGTGKFVTGFTYADNKLTITRADVALDDISDKEKIALAADLGVVTNLKTTAQTAVGAINEHDIEIGNLSELNTVNKGSLVNAINEALQAVEVGGTGSVVTVVKENKDKYVVKQGGNQVGDAIEIADATLDVKVGGGLAGTDVQFSANATENKEITISHADTSNVANVVAADRTYVKSLTFDDFGHVTAVDVGTETVVDRNTAHTHAAGDGLKLGDVKGGIEGEVKYELNLKFGELKDNKLQLLDATNNTVIAEFDAAAFIEDSYLNEVTYKDENGDNILEFTFTLNDGTTRTVDVDLSHLVDVYTADETSITLVSSGDGKVFKIKESGVKTEHIKDGNVTEAKLEQNVQTALGLARTALQSHQDISGKADKVTGAVAGNFAGLDANGNLTDSGKKAADFQEANATLKHIADNYTVNDNGYFDGSIRVGNTQTESALLTSNGLIVESDAVRGSTNYKRDTITRFNDTEDINHTYNLPTESGTIATHQWVEGKGYATEKWVKDKNYLTEIATTKNHGLTVTNKNCIDIDTDVVFVLDCNW